MTVTPSISFEQAISHGPLRAVHMGQRSFTWERVALVDNIDDDPLSHLPEREASEAFACHQWANAFALFPYKCHEQIGSSQICKPSLKTRLLKHELRLLFRSNLPMQFNPSDGELRQVIKHEIFAPRKGQFRNPPSSPPLTMSYGKPLKRKFDNPLR